MSAADAAADVHAGNPCPAADYSVDQSSDHPYNRDCPRCRSYRCRRDL